MKDERDWVPVEVLWDEGLDEEVEWDASGWDDEPLFDAAPRLARPVLPLPQRPPRPPMRFADEPRPPRDKDRPKRKEQESAHLTKRRRKKLRAWELDDEE